VQKVLQFTSWETWNSNFTEGRGEAGMPSPSEPQKETTHWHLDFRGLAFRSMREQIFVLAI
jgi:hypothetical protein